MHNGLEHVAAFLAGGPFAVVGASRDRGKYGNKVLRAYRQQGYVAYAVNPNERAIEGRPCYADLASLPEKPHGVSIVTPPAVTARVVEQAADLAIEYLWMQPGAESEAAVARARQLGMKVIAGGPCLLVMIRFSDDS